MAKKSPKPKLAEAGPGAGKTHSMVDEIVSAIQALPPHRYLAAITYTNAAANTIRERLARRVQLRRNVFVGTTHSFVSRFVLGPCAELLSLLPANRIYAAVDVNEKGRGASKYKENLIKKGIVPYDAMISVSRKILATPGIRDRICRRLAYIFIDEFQDADRGMLEIFEHFRKDATTIMYAVGDPEQYVMSFTYENQKPPKFGQIPFFQFKKIAESWSIVENHRSNGEIVRFANQFRQNLQQTAVKPYRNEPRVLFLPDTSLVDIVNHYHVLTTSIETEGEKTTRLYLSEENATFDSICDRFQLTPISNVARKNRTLLGDALELLSLALDRDQRKACKDFGLSRLEWRAAGARLLRDLLAGQYDIGRLVMFVADKFGYQVSKSRMKLIEDGMDVLSAALTGGGSTQTAELCASIRKAKGLQADAALVVAKSGAQLKKWLQTDPSRRVEDGHDQCRLGYIAFTRPREMLCIACLKGLDTELTQIIQKLGIQTVPANNNQKDYEQTNLFDL